MVFLVNPWKRNVIYVSSILLISGLRTMVRTIGLWMIILLSGCTSPVSSVTSDMADNLTLAVLNQIMTSKQFVLAHQPTC